MVVSVVLVNAEYLTHSVEIFWDSDSCDATLFQRVEERRIRLADIEDHQA
jgi:hypothetical protein